MTQTTPTPAPRLESPGPRQPFLLAALKSAGAVLLLEGTQLFVFFAGLVLLEISYGGEEATSRYYAWSNELAFLAAGFILLTVALIYIFRRRSCGGQGRYNL